MIWYADGYMLGRNPGTKGGVTIMSETGEVKGYGIKNSYLTNNEVELRACLYALENASEKDIIIVDSRNTLAWIQRGVPRARPDLKEYSLKAKKLQKEKDILLKWKPRNENLAGIYNEYTLK